MSAGPVIAGSVVAGPGEPAARRPLLVWCAGTSWDRVVGTDRQMATSMSSYADILWVDPPVSPLTPARFAGGAGRGLSPTIVTTMPGITRLRTRALPLHSRQGIRTTTFPLLRLQVRWALRRLGRTPLAVVACSLDDVLGRWGPGVRNVLYGTDDYVAGAQLMHLNPRRIQAEERRALQRADVAAVVSDVLEQRWRSLGFARPLVVVPNGVDSGAYAGIGAVAPADDVDLPHPVAGVVGQLSDRIDIELLESVVAAGCSLLLVGPHDPAWEPRRFGELAANPRVTWVGAKPFSDLPRYLRRMDVGLTPYRDTAFNRAAFPLKTLEYLAAGRPVLSTDSPAVRWLSTDMVAVSGRAEFGSAAYALATAQPEAGAARRRADFAAEHDWDRRARTFAAAIGITTGAPGPRAAGRPA